ncbi:hypothetical protein WA577_007329, partial [Blastocystis sp. JDR]
MREDGVTTERRVDPNKISLNRYHKKRQQQFNKNSNIISKYRKQRDKLYEEAGVVVDYHNNASEDEALLEETEVPKHRKREKARSSKPDPFFHAKRLAEQHRLEVEEKKKEKEQKEKEISSNLKHRKEVAKQMKKRTHKGQPLMKYQIPNLLEKIESR